MNSRNISNLSRCVQPSLGSLLSLFAAFTLTAAMSLVLRTSVISQTLLLDRPLVLKWRYFTNETSSVAPLKDADAIYLPLVGGDIVSLRLEDGQLLWKTDIGGDVLLTPSADSDRLYVASEVQRTDLLSQEPMAFLRSISKSSGVILWFNALPRKVQHTCDSDGSSILVATFGDIVIGVDKRSGSVKWSSQLPDTIALAPISSGGRIYVPLLNGDLVVLNVEDGKTQRRYQTHIRFASFALSADEVINWATPDGYVNSATETDGTLVSIWHKRVGAEIQSLNMTTDGLLIVTRDNSVTYMKRQNGKRLWKRRLPDRLATQPVVRDGFALFAPLGEDTCIVLSLRDGRQVNTLYLGADNSVVAPPVVADDYLLVPTKLGLLAFTAAQ